MAKRKTTPIVIPPEILAMTEKEARAAQDIRNCDSDTRDQLLEALHKAQEAIAEHNAFDLALSQHIVNLINKRVGSDE